MILGTGIAWKFSPLALVNKDAIADTIVVELDQQVCDMSEFVFVFWNLKGGAIGLESEQLGNMHVKVDKIALRDHVVRMNERHLCKEMRCAEQKLQIA